MSFTSIHISSYPHLWFPLLLCRFLDSLPTFTATVPIIRWILLRERIDIVHAHQATSVLANESVAIGSAMGKATVYTDHSLFGFNDMASVILNRVSALDTWFSFHFVDSLSYALLSSILPHTGPTSLTIHARCCHLCQQHLSR